MNLFTESPYWNKKNVPIIPITDYLHNVLWKEEKLLSLFVCECVWLRERKCVYCQGGCNATTQPPAVDGWEISRKRGLTVNRDFSRDVMRTLRVASHIWQDTTNGKMCILQLAGERLPKVSGYHWVIQSHKEGAALQTFLVIALVAGRLPQSPVVWLEDVNLSANTCQPPAEL